MSKDIQTVSNGMQVRTSAEAFFARHRDLEDELFLRLDNSGKKRSPTSLKEMTRSDRDVGQPSPFLTQVDQLRRAAFGKLLKATEQENSPEALKQLLEIFLMFMRVKTSEGVFTPMRTSGRPGRRVSSQTALIYSTWLSLGKPSPSTNQLAMGVFGPAFTRANGVGRRRLRDQCRRALQRCLDRLAKQNSLPGGTE